MPGAKNILIVITVLFDFISVNGMPVELQALNIPSVQRYYPPMENPRPFFNSIGDLIGGSGFLPIEVNVPDTISNIINTIQSITSGGGGSQIGSGVILNSLIQRFPFLQNVRPRPTNAPYIVFIIPNSNRKDVSLRNPYGPLDSNNEDLLFYP